MLQGDLAHRLVAGAGGAAARGLTRRPAHVPQRFTLHPLELPLGIVEANPEVEGDVGQHGRDESCKGQERCQGPPPAGPQTVGAGGGRGDLPCSRGLAMVARTAPWLSHACFASGHFTISALSWPLKLKHCMGRAVGWASGCSHHPPNPEPCTLPTQLPFHSPVLPQQSFSPLHPHTSCPLNPSCTHPHGTSLPASLRMRPHHFSKTRACSLSTLRQGWWKARGQLAPLQPDVPC